MIGCFSDFYFGVPGVSSSRGSSPDSLVLGLLGTQEAWTRCLLRLPLVAGDPRCLYLVSGGYRSFMSVSRKNCWTGGMPLGLLPCCTSYVVLLFWKIFKRARNHSFGSMQFVR